MNDEGLRFTPTGRLRKGQDLVMVDSIEEAVANQERRSEPRGEGLREAVRATVDLPEDAPDKWRQRDLYAAGWGDRGDAIRQWGDEHLLAATPPAPALRWTLLEDVLVEADDGTRDGLLSGTRVALAPERQETPPDV